MQKQVIGRPREISDAAWLDVESKAAVEITSEDPTRPIESAIRLGVEAGWRAADPCSVQISERFENRIGYRRSSAPDVPRP